MTVYNLTAKNLVSGTAEREAALAEAKAEHQREFEALRAELKTAKPAGRKRKMSLSDAIKQAKKAGEAVAGATLAADGSVSLTFGQPDATKANGNGDNPWDEVLTNAADQKRTS
jgi:septal ring factor EnvC (AmiA/AmiB activator)